MTIHDHPTRTSDILGLTPVYNASHRESDDSYGKVVLQLAPRWRVIECRNAEQWIIQHRSAEPLHGGVWRSISYVVSRDKLIELSAISKATKVLPEPDGPIRPIRDFSSITSSIRYSGSLSSTSEIKVRIFLGTGPS